ncbi:hypothetical protein MKA48_00010 [[Clostridium] innocuum]|nr:hypothetical protein [[Clostridium] innocuum]
MKTEYASYINTYPTIFLSFADAKESKRRIVKSIKEQLLNVYDEYACVLEKLSMFEKPKFDLILRGLSDLEDENLEPVDHAISFLMFPCSIWMVFSNCVTRSITVLFLRRQIRMFCICCIVTGKAFLLL